MKNMNSYSENTISSEERLSWILIGFGAASILAAKIIFMTRFVEVNPLNPLAGLRQMLTWGELCFLLFPYLGLAYFRLYAAKTPGTRRLAGFLAAAFLVSGLIMSFGLMNGGREAGFNFYFHSLVCLALQSIALLPVVGGLWPGRVEGEWRPAEFLAFIPLLAAAMMLMSHVSMMWTRQLTGAALTVPYIFLTLDGTRRLIMLIFDPKEPVESVEDEPILILKALPSAVEFARPSVVKPLLNKAILSQVTNGQLPRQAQSGGIFL